MHDRDTKFTAAFVDILKAGGVRHNALPKASPNLNVVRIVLPPLADRREDIPLLLHHFIRQFNAQQGKRIEGISEEAVGVLLGHAFPGNIRELQNIIERASVLCRNRRIEVDCLPAELVAAHRTADPPPNKKTHGALSDSEVETILRTLREHDGHRGKTAAALGVDKSTLWRKMKKHGITFHGRPRHLAEGSDV